MIQLSMIFSAIAFYYECYKSERKKASGMGGNSKSGRDSPSFPDTYLLCMPITYLLTPQNNSLYCLLLKKRQLLLSKD